MSPRSIGVVVVHGLGGTPASVAPVATAIAEAGYTVRTPLLPGHGTEPTALIGVTWQQWRAAVAAAADELRATGSADIVLIGQSLGGSLALVLAAARDDVTGVATINALASPADPDAVEHLEYLQSRGRTMQPAGEPDIRDPDARDEAYDELALSALIELTRAGEAAHDAVGAVVVPAFVASSARDETVDPSNSDLIAAAVAAPVTRLILPNGGHVAALDLDRDILCRELLTWLADLTDRSATPV